MDLDFQIPEVKLI